MTVESKELQKQGAQLQRQAEGSETQNITLARQLEISSATGKQTQNTQNKQQTGNTKHSLHKAMYSYYLIKSKQQKRFWKMYLR